MRALAAAARDLQRAWLDTRSGRGLATQVAALYPAGAEPGDVLAELAQLVAYGAWAARCVEPGSAGLSRLRALGRGSPLAGAMLDLVCETAAQAACRPAIERIESAAALLPARATAILEGYEPFLDAYDAAQRRARGVYFTPPPVVDCLLDRVEHALRMRLGVSDGLRSARAGDGEPLAILDPAAGTGAFLLRLLQRAGDGAAELATRLYGFELLPVPYLVCHMLLSLELGASGHAPGRLEVYLADALGDRQVSAPSHALARALREERAAAAWLRETREIAVVVGNPPYRRGSAQAPARRKALLAAYTATLSGERNVQPLSDDYVLFMRAAQLRIEARGSGVVGLVTPSAFLSGRLYRGMREQLRRTFQGIEIIDLHGSVRRRRAAERDESVFRIAHGVAISVLARGGRTEAPRYRSLTGSRDAKLQALRARRLGAARESSCLPPLFLFAPAPATPAEYASFTPLDELFTMHSVGGKPGDDAVLVGFEPGAVLANLRAAARALCSSAPDRPSEARRKLARYLGRPDACAWAAERVRPYAYRPFDVRYCYDEPALWTRPVRALRERVDGQPLLLVSRVVKDDAFAHAFVSRLLPDVIALSATSSVNCHVFPMSALEPARARAALGFEPARAELFDYIYGVLHSPSYRTRYFPALCFDYPRIPLPRARTRFAAVARIGRELRELHLWEREPPASLRPRFVDGGDRRIRRVGERGRELAGPNREAGRGRLCINAVSYFEPIPAATWSHRVGGYQVCYKWLNDRRLARRELSDEEVERYRTLVAILSQTRLLMQRIDAAEPEGHGVAAAAPAAKRSSSAQ